jgi:dUTP pyrophosphatase
MLDADFCGEKDEVKVILQYIPDHNDIISKITINKGDRIAQLMFQRLDRIPMELGIVFNDTARGTGGFGSTGV